MEANLPDDKVATQRNDLLHGKQTFSLIQKQILTLAVKQIKRTDTDFEPYTVYIKDLIDAGTSKEVYSRIEKEVDAMSRKILLTKQKVEGSKHPQTTRRPYFYEIKHKPGEGKIILILHDKIKEMLLLLKEQGNFTAVPVAELMTIRSTYGQRMYEMLYSWRNTGIWRISVDELRFQLDCEKKYLSFAQFRKRVLNTAQTEIHTHTNMRFSWKEEKNAYGRGRAKRVTDLVFDISFNQNQLQMFGSVSDKLENYKRIKERMEKIGLSKTLIRSVQKRFSELTEPEKERLNYMIYTDIEVPIQTDSAGEIKDKTAWAKYKLTALISS